VPRLQELGRAIASHVAAEALFDVDPGQHRALGRLVVGGWLVLVDRDNRVRARLHLA